MTPNPDAYREAEKAASEAFVDGSSNVQLGKLICRILIESQECHGKKPIDSLLAADRIMNLIKGEGFALGSDWDHNVKAQRELTLEMLEEWKELTLSTDCLA